MLAQQQLPIQLLTEVDLLMIGVDALMIQGRVLANTPATSISGRIMDRIIEIELADRHIIELFDDNYPFAPLTEDLAVGVACTVLVGVQIGTRSTHARHGTPVYGTMHGVLVVPHWVPPHDPAHHFRHAGPRLYHNAGGFAIVEAHIGLLLFGPDDIPADAQAGDHLIWHHLRYELLAWA